MKDLIIPLFGNISVGTVQKLYNKSRPPPPPIPGGTDVYEEAVHRVAAALPHALADRRARGDLVCLMGEPLAKALTLSRSRSSKLWQIPRRKCSILTLKNKPQTVIM